MTRYMHNRNAYTGAPENIHTQFYYSVVLKMKICSNATDILGNNMNIMQFSCLLMLNLVHEKH